VGTWAGRYSQGELWRHRIWISTKFNPSYCKQALRQAERNYSNCENECLALVSGVLHYHEFLQPKPFLIKTDNSALKYLDSVKHITEKLGRWHMLLLGWKYRIEHIKGSKNVVADTLSRIDLLIETNDVEDPYDKVANLNSILYVTLNDNTTSDENLVHDRSDHVWAISLNRLHQINLMMMTINFVTRKWRQTMTWTIC